MDNKYGLGSTKVATEHHETHHKSPSVTPAACRFCKSQNLTLSPTMQDHMCNNCGEWQNDIPTDYSMGRSSHY